MKLPSLFALFLLPLSLAGQVPVPATPPLRTLNVSGSAEIKVAPDEVFLHVGVETRHADLAEAKQENDAAIARALAFLRESGLDSKNVQTDFLSVEPHYDHSRVQPDYYAVRKSMDIKLTETGKFEGILTGLLGRGMNTVHGVEFRTSKLRQHRDAARAMAIRAAREKAEALARESGLNCGPVQNINAQDWGGFFSGGGSWGGGYRGGGFNNVVQNVASVSGGGGGDEGGEQTLAAGQISVSATVTASFALE